MRDLRKVGRPEGDGGEASFLVGDGLLADAGGFAGLDGGVFPCLEVVLAGDEAHHGDRHASLRGFDESGEFLDLPTEEVAVGEVERQPQDEFVEQQHHGLVAEPFGVSRDGGETVG